MIEPVQTPGSHPRLDRVSMPARWKWRAGDVAFWDKRATQHYASSDYYPHRQVMQRVTICGDRPY